MNGFLIFCIIASTAANQLGYNYEQIGQNAAFGGIGSSGNQIEGQGIDIRFGGNTIGATNAFASGPGGFNHPNAITDHYSSDGGPHSNAPNTEYLKEFYSYTAPEEDFTDPEGIHNIGGSLKKNLRVIFIKAPENQGLTNAALQLAKQASEDRTAIYVLTKQTDIGELASQLQTIKGNNPNKPEVHFVKYRTPEDALRAQQAIQAQYDALGGQTRQANEEVAPVLNFASSVGLGGGDRVTSSSFDGKGVESGAYLPPTSRRT